MKCNLITIKSLIALPLIACSAVSTAQLYSLQYKGEILAGTVPVIDNDFRGVFVLPTGHFLVWGGQGSKGLVLWFSRTGSLVRTVETARKIYDVDIGPDGSIYLATLTESGAAKPMLMKYSVNGVKEWEQEIFVSGSTTARAVKVDQNGNVHDVFFHTISNSNTFEYRMFSPAKVSLKTKTLTAIPSVSNVTMCTNPNGDAYIFGQSGVKLSWYSVETNLGFQAGMLPNGFDTFVVTDSVYDPISNCPVVSAYGSSPNGPLTPVAARFPRTSGLPSVMTFSASNMGQRILRGNSGKFHLYGAPVIMSNPAKTLISRLETNQAGAITSSWMSTFAPAGNLVPITGDMTLDAFDESYVAASFAPTGLSKNHAILTKVNSAGALRFNASVDFPDSVYQMKGIAIHHSSGDICMVGLGNHPTNKEGVIAIFKQAPIAIADSYLTIKQNTVFVSPKTVTTNDRQWQGASITLTQPVSTGTLTLQQNGVFTYTPPNGFLGYATFKYRLTKPGLTPSGEALVTLRVIP